MDNSEPARGLTQDTLLNRMTNRIRQSLELQEILDATVAEMRSFLQTDRVKVYRFQPDGAGQVIAESIYQNRLPSLLGLHFPASDLSSEAREMFVKVRQRVIVDVVAQRTTLSWPDNAELTCLTPEAGQQQPIQAMLQRPVAPCHLEYLTTMGVQSSLVVPILHGAELWGLLVSHHAEPKNFSQQDLQIVQMVCDQVSIAIAQSHLLTQARAKAQRETTINRISTLLHASLQVQEVSKVVLEQIVIAVEASGGRLYISSTNLDAMPELYTYGSQPQFPDGELASLESHPFWQPMLADPTDWGDPLVAGSEINHLTTNFQVITDIYQVPQLSEVIAAFQPTKIRSLLLMPLQYRGQSLGCLTIFRDEIDTDIAWAGKFDPDERQNRVRASFEEWRELKSGQARPWIAEEVELVQALGNHLIMAVMQHRLFHCEREQRLLVEMRNQELNSARAVAEEASRLKSDFLSSTSHELRTPLASTLNYLKLLKEGLYDNEEELKEYIHIAHHSAENLVAIINDVLDIAKIEAGRMSVNLEQMALLPLFKEQQSLFSLDSRRKGIDLVIECEVEHAYADRMKLRQILTNLLSNAFKFTSSGEVRVRAIHRSVADNHMVEISVADTGIGIDSKNKELLFEPFVQADGSIKRGYGGTGLGLTVCKQLVELMGGHIWLESAGRNEGTTVTFTLLNRTEV